MDNKEIRIKAIGALQKYLRSAALHREPTNYVKVSRRLYEGQTIDEIFARAKQNWQG